MSQGAKQRRERLCETGRRRWQHTASTNHLLWWQRKGRQLIALAFGSHARAWRRSSFRPRSALTKRSRDGRMRHVAPGFVAEQIRSAVRRTEKKGDDLSIVALETLG
jgi:hypothetical protein